MIFVGDSQTRTVIDSIGREFAERGLIRKENLVTNSHMNHLHFQLRTGTRFGYIWIDNINHNAAGKPHNNVTVNNLWGLFRDGREKTERFPFDIQSIIDNRLRVVVIFNFGLWPAIKRNGVSIFYSHAPAYFYAMHRLMQRRFGAKIIWKTVSCNNKNDDIKRIKQMNVMANKLASVYEWELVNDAEGQSCAEDKRSQIKDNIHYPVGSQIMQHTKRQLAEKICSLKYQDQHHHH